MVDERRYAVGIDLGTSGMKAVALDGSGRVAARAQCGYPTSRPEPGASEQDPVAWFEATETVLGELARTCDPRRWAGIGLSGMIPTLVAADERGEAVGAAVTWEDARADSFGQLLEDAVGERALYETTGQRVDGRYLVPMFLRLLAELRARDGTAQRVATIRSAKDHLFDWLTGELATDPSTATGFGCYDLATKAWSGPVRDAGAAIAGGELPELPPVVASTAWRPIRGSRAAALGLPVGLPVVVGAADSVLGALGLGVERPGSVAYVAGTSSVLLGVSERAVVDDERRCLLTPLALSESLGVEMDILSTGSSIAWLARLLGTADAGECAALASGLSPGDAPLFLPYLGGGEQGCLWDPSLRGALVGLELRHERGHLARGLLDGIVVESRRCVAVLEELGVGCDTIHVAGGSASSSAFLSGLADATGHEVRFAGDGDVDFSAIGAARLVEVAVLGESAPTAGALERAAARTVVEPDPGRWAVWDELARSYDEALAALRPARRGPAPTGKVGTCQAR